jgi:hypothetical protein
MTSKEEFMTKTFRVFCWIWGVQFLLYALVVITTLWSWELYPRYMFLYYPVGVFWERVLPWGRDRGQIPWALFLWIPLIGSLVYSSLGAIIASAVDRKWNPRNGSADPTE